MVEIVNSAKLLAARPIRISLYRDGGIWATPLLRLVVTATTTVPKYILR